MDAPRGARAGLVCALGALLALSAGQSVAAGPRWQQDPATSRVTMPCEIGVGAITARALPLGEGFFRVEVRTRRLVEGSRWLLELFADQGSGSDAHLETVRRRAVEGSWSFTRRFHLESVTGAEDPSIFVTTYARRVPVEGGRRAGSCSVGQIRNGTVRWSQGIGSCGSGGQRFVVMTVRQRRDSSVAIGVEIESSRPSTRWALHLALSGENGTRAVSFEDYTDRYGSLRSRVRFSDPPHEPVSALRAVSAAGPRCRMAFDPPERPSLSS